MKTRKKSAIAIVFALMTMVARPQLAFAQLSPDPITGSWERLKTIPPGDEVVVRLRSGQTLKGRLINVSDTVLTIEQGKKTTDLSRGDTLRVYRLISKSAKKATLIGLGVGAGIGGLGSGGAAASASGSGEPGEYGLAILVYAAIGAGIGALIGYITGSAKHRELIYETK